MELAPALRQKKTETPPISEPWPGSVGLSQRSLIFFVSRSWASETTPPNGPRSRAGNEPSYSGSARKKLSSSSARELNEPSLSLNLGLINLGLGSGST